jgi:uncharacterized protein
LGFNQNAINLELLGQEIQRLFPQAIGAYLFGSAASHSLRDESDLDIAILQPDELIPLVALELKSYISQTYKRDCDIVDLVRADTVTAAQIVTTSLEIFTLSPVEMAEFETMALSRYALLNEERSEILRDIEQTGKIYGR